MKTEQSIERNDLNFNNECFSLRCDCNWCRACRAEYQLSPEGTSSGSYCYSGLKKLDRNLITLKFLP
ncbi:MAG TPA: hypothetical protein PK816_13680, partial [Candidatus Cloacimonadota bacterium]|nr:hypothetical protein [Candidatus Cloacimonadota bacterium]